MFCSFMLLQRNSTSVNFRELLYCWHQAIYQIAYNNNLPLKSIECAGVLHQNAINAAPTPCGKLKVV